MSFIENNNNEKEKNKFLASFLLQIISQFNSIQFKYTTYIHWWWPKDAVI